MSYQGQVDAFGVYCPWDGRVFFVPMAAVGEITSEVSLRLLPARNGQQHGIRGAAAYVLDWERRTGFEPATPTLAR